MALAISLATKQKKKLGTRQIFDRILARMSVGKARLKACKMDGFSVKAAGRCKDLILYIPLRPKGCVLANAAKIDVKSIMERRTVKEVKQWRTGNLKANPMARRKSLLIAWNRVRQIGHPDKEVV